MPLRIRPSGVDAGSARGGRSWADALRASAGGGGAAAPADDEEATGAHMRRVLADIDDREQAAHRRQHPSYAVVPTFWRPSGPRRPRSPPKDDKGSDEESQQRQEPHGLRDKWRGVAKARFLQRRSRRMWGSAMMKLLWTLLQEYAESGEATLQSEAAGEEPPRDRIGYERYLKVRDEMARRLREQPTDETAEVGDDDFGAPGLSACSFFALRPEMDEKGRVLIYKIFSLVHRKATLYQTRIELELNDIEGRGYLREPDLEAFIYDLLPTVPALSEMPDQFHPFYVCGAVRKFFFFLDTARRGRVYIDDMMQSFVLQELMDLQGTQETIDESNWFSPEKQLYVYRLYMTLDRDRNGMLSREELYEYSEESYTRVFIDRAFEVSQTYGGEMDYKRYMDFVLATDHVDRMEALPFFWQVFDLKGDGMVTPVIIQSFFRAVHTRLEENGMGDLSTEESRRNWARLIENVTVEVFDIVNPRTPLCIKLDDLKRCKCRGTVLSMLIDFRAFYRYDSREQPGGQANAQQQHLLQLSQDILRDDSM